MTTIIYKKTIFVEVKYFIETGNLINVTFMKV